jgi:hypothetical protein
MKNRPLSPLELRRLGLVAYAWVLGSGLLVGIAELIRDQLPYYIVSVSCSKIGGCRQITTPTDQYLAEALTLVVVLMSLVVVSLLLSSVLPDWWNLVVAFVVCMLLGASAGPTLVFLLWQVNRPSTQFHLPIWLISIAATTFVIGLACSLTMLFRESPEVRARRRMRRTSEAAKKRARVSVSE